MSFLRPAGHGIKARVMAWVLANFGMLSSVARRFLPVVNTGKFCMVMRYDDVREVFEADDAFAVPYKAKLDVIMGNEPFFLGMGDTAEYRRDTEAMRQVVRRDDISTRIAPATIARAEALVEAAGGGLEVVDFAGTVTFDVLCPYFGITPPPGADLRLWAMRLFEFQFADQGNDPALRDVVDCIAPTLRGHIDGLIAARRRKRNGVDDVLGRSLARQAEGAPGFTDVQIRSALMGFLVGGLPQPPMVVPQALEQLLRRPAALAGARRAALADDDTALAGYVFEALRFDPLAPFLQRVATRDRKIAAGTRRETTVKAGTSLFVSFASAMLDERRIPDPQSFNPRRLPHEYMHFGHGLHTCFGIHINHALVPLTLKALLRRPGLRRAPGADGHLTKQGPFAERLVVQYD